MIKGTAAAGSASIDAADELQWPHATASVITPPQPQHPHRQIELRDSASGVQQFETYPRQHVEDDADRENKMGLLRRIDLSKS
jgi:hypothetical protein